MSRTEVTTDLPRAENTKPKLVFLAHPFPPSHIIGAVRSWNIAKHLSRLGWQVTVVTPRPNLRADVDDGGRSDVADGVSILRFLFASGTPPRPPGPGECGPDPTDDGLRCDYASCP